MKIATYTFLFLGLFLSTIACKQNKAEANNIDGTQINITKAEAVQLMETNKDIILIDVRTPGEIALGKISDAALEIDFRADGFKDKILALDKNKEYIIYCKSGGRSSKALAIMQEGGYHYIHNLLGGYSGWQ